MAGWVGLLVALPVAACTAVLDFDVEGYPVEAGANGDGGRSGSGASSSGDGGNGAASGGRTGGGGSGSGGTDGGGTDGGVDPDGGVGGDTDASSGGAVAAGGTVGAGGNEDAGGGPSSGGGPGAGGDGNAGGTSSGGTGTGGASSGGAGGCASPTTWYEDVDGDTFGDPDSNRVTCAMPAPGNWVTNDDDCQDNRGNVNPNHTTPEGSSFTAPGGGQSYDWDCSGTEEGDPAQKHKQTCTGLGGGAACTGKGGYLPRTDRPAGTNAYCGSITIRTCAGAIGLACLDGPSTNVPSDPRRCL